MRIVDLFLDNKAEDQRAAAAQDNILAVVPSEGRRHINFGFLLQTERIEHIRARFYQRVQLKDQDSKGHTAGDDHDTVRH